MDTERTMEFERESPGWQSEGAEPPKALKEGGFTPGYKPPAGYFNWFWTRTSGCISELQAAVKRVFVALLGHIDAKNNPHGVSAAQVGAPTKAAHNELKTTVAGKAETSWFNQTQNQANVSYVWGYTGARNYQLYRTAELKVAYATSAGAAVDQRARNTANAALPKAGGTVSGALAVGGNLAMSGTSLIFNNGGTEAGRIQGVNGSSFTGMYYRGYNGHRFYNGNASAYASLWGWEFISMSQQAAKQAIHEPEKDVAMGLLAAKPMLYRAKARVDAKTKNAFSAMLQEETTFADLPKGTRDDLAYGEEELGFMAEQLEEVFPEGVAHDPLTGEVQGVRLYAMVTGLVMLCQRQQEQLDALKQRLEVLEADGAAKGEKEQK